MKKQSYLVIKNEEYAYSFVSTGPKGDILKVVLFQEWNGRIFNLALLDYDPITNSFSDISNSNNGDLALVLSTVVRIVSDFLTSKPESSVYVEANTRTKNLLYNRIIRNNLSEIEKTFLILGSLNGVSEPYNSANVYDSFYIYTRNNASLV